MSGRDQPIDGWYVAFMSSKAGPWYHKFLHPEFQHCFAWGWDSHAERWVYLDARIDGANVRIFTDVGIEAALGAIAVAGGRILYARNEHRRLVTPRIMVTCVTMVEALLGLPWVCAFTPYRLYRILLARGAIEISGG